MFERNMLPLSSKFNKPSKKLELCLPTAFKLVFGQLVLQPWRCGDMFLQNAGSFNGLHGVITLKMKVIIMTAVWASNSTWSAPILLLILTQELQTLYDINRACGSAVGWGTMLQATRSLVRVSDEVIFFSSIYLILPAALWPWSQLSL
jgi:hypothetical protein